MYKLGVSSKEQQKQPEDKSILQRVKDKYLGNAIAFGIGSVGDTLINLENHYTPQENFVGEVFTDYFADKLNKDKGYKVEYFQTIPRSPSAEDANFATVLTNSVFAPRSEAYSMIETNPKGTPKPSEVKDYINTLRKNDLIQALSGGIEADKLYKNKALYDDIMEGASYYQDVMGASKAEALEKSINDIVASSSKNIDDIDAIIKAPRNNIRAIAHEMGHVVNELKDAREISPGLSKIKSIASKYLAGPLVNIWSEVAPSHVQKAVNALGDRLNKSSWTKYPKDLALGVMGYKSSLPVAAVNTLSALGVLSPDSMNSLKEKDPTGIVEYIDKNPVQSVLLASLPQLAVEANTTIPGTKAVYNFFKDLKNGTSELINNHALAKTLNRNVSPVWEAAKFMGKNLFTTALAPIGASLGAAYIMNKLKEEPKAEALIKKSAYTKLAAYYDSF